ncbi:unnamed protein product, partial [Amaranthus hypochondriacus]
MINDKKIANAVSGKTARACDCCIIKRARWYCPADDAFLCQSCDGSVHSANPLARRHERVRLKTASLNPSNELQRPDLPTWHRGLTRKPRTPRHGKNRQLKPEKRKSIHVIVPDLGMEDTTSSQEGDTEDQLLYRVPVFDPFVSGYESRSMESEGGFDMGKSLLSNPKPKDSSDEYLPFDLDLDQFAADVETLLGKGLDDESYGIDELGLLDCNPTNNNNNNNENHKNINGKIKEEYEMGNEGMMMTRCDDHDYDEEEKKVIMIETSIGNEMICKLDDDEDDDETEDSKEEGIKRRKILLRLDYEAISDAWASNGSPWMTGQRPQINLEDCWPHFMVIFYILQISDILSLYVVSCLLCFWITKYCYFF